MSHVPKYSQSSKALQLSLLEGRLQKQHLSIYLEESFVLHNGYELELGIIGESHFMSLRRKDETLFTELFAGVTLEGTQSFILEGKRFSTEYHNSTIDYNITIDVSDYDSRYIKKFELKEHDEHARVLSHNFAFEGEAAAVTTLRLEDDNNGVHLKTLHAYPNEQLMVVSESHIQFVKASTKGAINE